MVIAIYDQQLINIISYGNQKSGIISYEFRFEIITKLLKRERYFRMGCRFLSMDRLPKRQLELLLELSDGVGYTQAKLLKKIHMQAPNISDMIGILDDQGIVFSIRGWTDSKGKSRRGFKCFIGQKDSNAEKDLNIFQKIFSSVMIEQRPDAQQRWLASNYLNSLIIKCGFNSVYGILEEYIEREEFRRIASRALLKQQAVIDEYIKIPESIKKYITEYRGFDLHDNLDEIKLLKILFRLDPAYSIKFHREYLAEPFAKLYRESTGPIILTADEYVTEGIRKFIEPDLFLNPFTSFPINCPVALLFERPFERLYSDFYLCDKSDIEKLISRAEVVYSNFADILAAGMVSVAVSNTLQLRILLKQYIFYWNVASQTLDCLYDYLTKLDFGSIDRDPVYHIYPEITGLQILNLADKKEQLTRLDKDVLNYNSLRLDVSDPIKEALPCNCFEKLGLKGERMAYADLLKSVKRILRPRFIGF